MPDGRIEILAELEPSIFKKMEDLKQTLKEVEAEANKLNKDFQEAFKADDPRNFDKALAETTKQIKAQGAEVVALKKRVEQLKQERRNANNPKEFIAYTKQIRKAKGEIKALNTETTKTRGGFNSFIGNITSSFGGAFSRGFTTAQQGVKGLIGTFKGLRLAIIGTGIGALLIALVSLVSFFTKTQRGADRLSRIMAGFGAAVSVIVDRASALGESLVNAFDNPKQALKDFGQLIQDNIEFRIKNLIGSVKGLGDAFAFLLSGEFEKAGEAAGQAFKDLGEGVTGIDFDAAAEGFKDIADEVAREAAEAARLEGLRQKLLDTEINFIKTRATLNTQIEEARLAAEDETLAYQDRIQALEDAAAIQDKITANEINLAQTRASILRQQVALGESSRDDLREVAESEARVIELTGERARAVKRLQTRINALRREQEASEKAEQKARESIEKRLQEARINAIQNVEAREIATAEFKSQLRLKEIQETIKDEQVKNELIKLENDKLNRDLAEINRKFAEKNANEEFKQSQQNLEAEFAQRRLLISQQRAEDATSQDQVNQQILALENERRQAQLTLAKDYGQATTAIEQEIANAQIEAINEVESAIDKILNNPKFQAAQDIGGRFLSSYQQGINNAIQKNDEFIQSLDKTIQGLEGQLEKENDLAEQGFANNRSRVEREIEFQKQKREEAVAEQERITERQRRLDNIQKNASIAVAIANILKESTKIGPLGLIAAGVGITALLSLLQNGIERANTISLKTGGSGDSFGMVTGRRHSQGGENFTDHIEVEKGENWGVLNRGASKKFGKKFHDSVELMNKGVDPFRNIKPMDISSMIAKGKMITPNYDYITSVTNPISTKALENEAKKTNQELKKMNAGKSEMVVNGKVITRQGNTRIVNGKV